MELRRFLGGSDGKEVNNLSALQEIWVLSLAGKRFPGEGNGYPLQYSCLENSKDRGTWYATVHEVTKNQTWMSDQHFHFFSWEIKFPSCLWTTKSTCYNYWASSSGPCTPQLERNMRVATRQAFVLQLRPNTSNINKERNQCFFKNHKTDSCNFTLIPSLID